MWSKKRDGSVNWSEPAKLFLIDLLKKNIVAISEDTQSLQKSKAWKNIYDACLQKGMPRTSIDRITRIWTRMKIAALKQQSDQKDSMLISKKLGQAIIGLLNRANFRDMMPKPKIKQEPVDSSEDGMSEPNPPKEHMNPVVLLNRIPTDSIDFKETKNDMKMSSAEDYWNTMKKVAENDLKLKMLQCEHEQERMEMERELHRKNQILLDCKIAQLNY